MNQKRNPKPLFKARPKPPDHASQLRQAVAEVDAEPPHWHDTVAELIRQFGDKVRPGGVYEVRTEHDPHCPALAGDPDQCRCNCVSHLVEVEAT